LSFIFSATHIVKSFHLRTVLKDVTFTLKKGETALLLGRNGSGKTTLLDILAGVMRPERGAARLGEFPLFTSDGRWRCQMVYLGHRAGLYPAFNARENLHLALRLRRERWNEEAFQNGLSRYGLQGRENDPIRIYSEGMLQRLGLIRLELTNWKLAFMDEPSSALDVEGIEALQETMERWRSQGRSVLFTSHDMSWGAATRADRALLLREGTIAQEIPDPGHQDLSSILREWA
jgi:ABC-type multidrug transport system ATPase subunit